MRRGRGSAEGVGARSGKGLHSTKDGNPRVGVRTGARHADGRYTDMIWKGVSREARLALLNIKTDNKTISQIYFTVKYI